MSVYVTILPYPINNLFISLHVAMWSICVTILIVVCLNPSVPFPPQPTNAFPELLNNNVTNGDYLRNLFEYLSVCPSP